MGVARSNFRPLRSLHAVLLCVLVPACAEDEGSAHASPGNAGSSAPDPRSTATGATASESTPDATEREPRSVVAARAMLADLERKTPDQLEPGDTLFQALGSAELDECPDTNLPPELAALLGEASVLVRTPIQTREWTLAGVQPRYAHLLGVPDTHQWYVRPRFPPGATEPVRIWVDGEPAKPWDGNVDTFPGCYVQWDEGKLDGVSKGSPRGVAVDSPSDPVRLFGAVDGLGEARAEDATVEDLVSVRSLGGVTRAWLDLPAPSTLRFPFESCPKVRLEVVPAVADVGWKLHDDVVESTQGLCKGVRFQVTVLCEGQQITLYDRAVGPKQVGSWTPSAFLNLEPFAGRKAELVLKTVPMGDDRSFAYSSWGELMLHGEHEKPSLPHVVLVDIDTLRPDRMGCYGGPRDTTPWLDDWTAAHAVRFAQALAPCSWTLPSTTTMLTGLAVHQHGRMQGRDPLPDQVATLASILANRGYEALGCGEGTYLGPTFGLDRGFHAYDNADSKVDQGQRWVRILDRLEKRSSPKPLFLFFHTYMVHTPYGNDDRFDDPKDPYQGRLLGKEITHTDWFEPFLSGKLDFTERERDYIFARYDAGIARMDELVRGLVERLESVFADEDYLLVFTSDHGEEFWEHDMVGHGRTLYQEVLAIPMIVRFPKAAAVERTGVRSDLAQLQDIVPTVLEAAGIPKPSFLPGRSLYQVGEAEEPAIAQFSPTQYSVQLGAHRYIHMPLELQRWKAPKEELFDHATDPRERQSVLEAEPDLAAELADLFPGFLGRWPSLEDVGAGRVEMSPEEIARLEQLGYKVPTDH